ncbi:MAG: hypothetical protein ACK5Q4_15595 [Phycisphaerae bacterium]|jgi:hypothetical protein
MFRMRKNNLVVIARLVGRAMTFALVATIAYWFGYFLALWRIGTLTSVDGMIEHHRYPTWLAMITGDWATDIEYASHHIVNTFICFALLLAAALVVARQLPLVLTGRGESNQHSGTQHLREKHRWRMLMRRSRLSWHVWLTGAAMIGLSTALLGDVAAYVVGAFANQDIWEEWRNGIGRKPAYHIEYLQPLCGPTRAIPLAWPESIVFTALALAMTVGHSRAAARADLRRRAVRLGLRCDSCGYHIARVTHGAPCSECGTSQPVDRTLVQRHSPVLALIMGLFLLLIVLFLAAPRIADMIRL